MYSAFLNMGGDTFFLHQWGGRFSVRATKENALPPTPSLVRNERSLRHIFEAYPLSSSTRTILLYPQKAAMHAGRKPCAE